MDQPLQRIDPLDETAERYDHMYSTSAPPPPPSMLPPPPSMHPPPPALVPLPPPPPPALGGHFPTPSGPADAVPQSRASVKRVLEVNSRAQFEQLLADAASQVVLVEFFAQWCGPCRLVHPKLEQLAAAFTDRAVVLKVDVDELEDLAMEFNVTSLPTFVIMRNRQTLQQLIGSNTDGVSKMMAHYCGADGQSALPPNFASDPLDMA